MNGYGVTNYDVSKPSYSYTTDTTEFHDELIKRNIITKVQAIMSKGQDITEEDANQIIVTNSKTTTSTSVTSSKEQNKYKPTEDDHVDNDDENDDDNEDFLDDEDDEFMVRYRQERMAELERSSTLNNCNVPYYGDVYYIDRTQWMKEVNDESIKYPSLHIIICLTSSDSNRTGNIESTIQNDLVTKYVHTKFICIPYHNAISNHFPIEHLPCLFIYQNGCMKYEIMVPQILPHYQTKQIEEIIMKHDSKILS